MNQMTEPSIRKYWQAAFWLAIFTIFYNLVEGPGFHLLRRAG